MAIQSELPTYLDYYNALLSYLKTIGNTVSIQDFSMNGNSTNLRVKVKEIDEIQASQPYFELTFVRAIEGHDNEQSGQDFRKNNYSQIGNSKKLLKTKKTLLERVEFQIDIVAQRHKHIIDTIQHVKRSMAPVGNLTVSRNGTDHTVAYHLDQGSMELESLQSTRKPWKL